MGYDGDSLGDWIGEIGRITKGTMRDITDATVDNWRDVTVKNTPIERFIKQVGTKPPYHLRNSWELSTLRIVHLPDTGGDDVYQKDVYTEVEYAPYVEEGTGLWGPEHRKYVIRPKKPGGWLSWIARDSYIRRDGSMVQAGQRVFAKEVLHPGSPGQHMLAIGQHMTEAQLEEIARPALDEWVRKGEAAAR